MLKKIEQMEALLRELKKDYLTAQNLFSGQSSQEPNKRGWIKCPTCGKSHRAGHPHLK